MTNQEAQAILTQSIADRADKFSESGMAEKKAVLLSFFQEMWAIFQVINNNVTIGGQPALFKNTGTTAQAKTFFENQINTSTKRVQCRFIAAMKPNVDLRVKFYINDQLTPSVMIGINMPNYESMKEFAGLESIPAAADFISDIIVKYKD